MMSPVDSEYDFMRELNFKYLRHVVLKFMLSRETEVTFLLICLLDILFVVLKRFSLDLINNVYHIVFKTQNRMFH